EGCDACDYTGYNGRALISEVMVMERDVSRVLNTGGGEAEAKEVLLQKGMKTMLHDGLLKLDMTTLNEIIRVIPHEMIKDFRLGNSMATKADKATQKNGSLVDTALPGNGHVVISDPKAEREMIDKLFQSYKTLSPKTDKVISKLDAPLFRKFIDSNYKQICSRFGCSNVNFFLKSNGERVDILASPGL
ncbi:hypothetical protein ACFLZM_02530, partial [Thermodesulfobacteriota bacterium]